ncbi:uncharacterized protein METZ01_LOCUS500959, partial [marine metagenome]
MIYQTGAEFPSRRTVHNINLLSCTKWGTLTSMVAAVPASMFTHGSIVHSHLYTVHFGFGGGFLIHNTILHPDILDSYSDSIVYNGRNQRRSAKYIYHVYTVRYRSQIWVTDLTQNLFHQRV